MSRLHIPKTKKEQKRVNAWRDSILKGKEPKTKTFTQKIKLNKKTLKQSAIIFALGTGLSMATILGLDYLHKSKSSVRGLQKRPAVERQVKMPTKKIEIQKVDKIAKLFEKVATKNNIDSKMLTVLSSRLRTYGHAGKMNDYLLRKRIKVTPRAYASHEGKSEVVLKLIDYIYNKNLKDGKLDYNTFFRELRDISEYGDDYFGANLDAAIESDLKD